MRAAGELVQHSRRVRGVRGLPQRLVSHPHYGVGGDEKIVSDACAQARPNRLGLLRGKPAHQLNGGLARNARLIDLRRDDGELKARILQQLAAAGRLRGEYHARPPVRVTLRVPL